MIEKMNFLQISALEKVFLDTSADKEEISSLAALKGERVSYQILYAGTEDRKTVNVSIECDRRIEVTLRDVANVPVALPVAGKRHDDFYEKITPGLYPDILMPLENDEICVGENSHSLYVTCKIPENIEKGTYLVKLTFTLEREHICKTLKIKILDCVLPVQETIYTQWLYCDCIADYYGMEVFSEEHWSMIEKFIRTAINTGVNMILTPVFTPPLDTAVGNERTTVQLVDVRYTDGEYVFGFDKLKRWIGLCKKCGINKFEISHLFTQWGTGKAPKIIAETQNGRERIFGWDTDATGKEYKGFLDCFIPKLIECLTCEGIYNDTYFHVSDEPDYKKDYDIYKSEYEIMRKYIPAEKIIDAMADYKFCEDGLAKHPVVLTLMTEEFFGQNKTDIWVYYCGWPTNQYYSNRLLAMPSGRTRIMGIQLYKYNIEGFLHWGFNFYNKRNSLGRINPFIVTDAGEEFPAGDSFSVYPGNDEPLESLRSESFYMGLQDNRACRLLESCIGREETIRIIEESGQISFTEYPYSNKGIEAIRDRVNRRLEEIFG